MHDFAEMVHRQRSYFLSQATKPYEFRMEKLRALSDWIDANESAVLDALARDLGKCAFEGYLTEVGMVRQELKDAMRHLARWMQAPAGAHGSGTVSWQVPHLQRALRRGADYVAVELSLSADGGAADRCHCGGKLRCGQAVGILRGHLGAASPELIAGALCAGVCDGGGGRTRGKQPACWRSTFDFIFFTGSPQCGAAGDGKGRRAPDAGEPGAGRQEAPSLWMRRRISRSPPGGWCAGKLLNAGQTCVAPDYVLVHHSREQALVEALIGRNPRPVHQRAADESKSGRTSSTASTLTGW